MRKLILLLLPLLVSAKQNEEQPSFDADLFRKNREVISPSLEFIYWSLEESDLDFAVQMNHPAWGTTPTFSTGDVVEANTDFQPGFRTALSYFRATRLWEVKAAYTFYYHNKSETALKPSDPDLFLTSTWPTNLPSPLQEASSTLRFHYHLGDLLVDRFFIPNPHFRLRLKGGLTGAIILQRWQTNYTDNAFVTTVHNRWRFIGAGLRTGIFLDWYWTHDIYITGSFSFASLLGRYRNHSKIQTTANPSGLDNPDVAFQDLFKKDLRIANQVQFLFGPSWQKNFTSLRVEIFAGYELTSWWNLQEIYRSLSGTPEAPKQIFTNTSLLALQGLTTRLTLDF